MGHGLAVPLNDAREQEGDSTVLMKRGNVRPPREWRPASSARERALRSAIKGWVVSDGQMWMHIAKTLIAALMATGIAMQLEMSRPSIAMATVFVLMQPLTGMVLSKCLYRIVGTFLGAAIAVLLAALFAQQPELYMAALAIWIAVCTAAALRFRNFRWYGFVLAGYTAALVGIPAVMSPDTVFLSALTRASEVTVGILCSAAVSALIFPVKSSTALQQKLKTRFHDLTGAAVAILRNEIDAADLEARIEKWVEEIVGFEADRGFAALEDPSIRLRSRRLARLNSLFTAAVTKLYAMNRLRKRLESVQTQPVLQLTHPYLTELADILALSEATTEFTIRAGRMAVDLKQYQDTLPRRVGVTRRQLAKNSPDLVLEFDTQMEMVYGFVSELADYALTYESLDADTHSFERIQTRYEITTNRPRVLFTFVRTFLVMSIVAIFWIGSEWPSGGMAVIGAAIACALTSASPRPAKMAAQMTIGAALATVAGYTATCYIYPRIDGYVLLGAMLVPILGGGVFLATRASTSGIGLCFSLFFCILAGPNNDATTYDPIGVFNNGLAVALSMFVAWIALEVIFPSQMAWRTRSVQLDLRRRVDFACGSDLPGLEQRFQSSTFELMFQLRTILNDRQSALKKTFRWMLLVLEVGSSVIALRKDAEDVAYKENRTSESQTIAGEVLMTLASFFEKPQQSSWTSALMSTEVAIGRAQNTRDAVRHEMGSRHRMQRNLAHLHFVRTALLDMDASLLERSREN